MNRVGVLAALAVSSVVGLLSAGISVAADAPAGGGASEVTTGSGKFFKGEATKTLKGRVWSQWADNPDSELLFGIQYWNTGDPASGNVAAVPQPDGRQAARSFVHLLRLGLYRRDRQEQSLRRLVPCRDHGAFGCEG